jgi:nitrate/TMAO reductase-like tetraheme cytochrome c subunit
MKRGKAFFLSVSFIILFPFLVQAAESGQFQYENFKKPRQCRPCHMEIYQEWEQSVMSQSFTHHWDDVEYFKLALPHALKLDKVAGVKGGCIACHGPLAFLTGDIPPKPPAAGTRANEGVSCEICHSITGSTEKEPFNFSYTIQPGKVKLGSRSDGISPFHDIKYSEFLRSPELCATCHDEQSPYGAWVKETYREWKAGPYAKEGARCQDCHMYRAAGKAATGGKSRADVAHHAFHGAHVASKLAGAVDIALYANADRIIPGSRIEVRATLFNGKTGHYIPSGSSEERMLWLEVTAIDAKGKTYNLVLHKKGFQGEEHTISDEKVLAYQAMGEIMGLKAFKGVKRDGDIPDGVRIFRKPFFDPKGRMTICQWYTAENTVVDYRIGPRETKVETYSWDIPKDISPGPVTIEATLYYSLVPSSVGEFLQLRPSEYAPIKVNTAILHMDGS